MRGRTHVTIGILTGVGLASILANPLSIVGVAITGISSLAPDLDEPRAMLGQKIELSPWRIKAGIMMLGLIVAAYSYARAKGMEQEILYFLAGWMFLIGLFLRERSARKIALVLTSVGIIIGGFLLGYNWLMLLGVFVGISPFFKHRTWTHSIWALILWGFIWNLAEQSLHLPHLMEFAVAGYTSHLIADSLTKDRVMWLYPWKKHLGLPWMKTGSPSGNMIEWVVCFAYGALIVMTCGVHFKSLLF